MQNEKRKLSLLLYYSLTSSLTNLFFVAFGAIVFTLFPSSLLSSKFDVITIILILSILLPKSLVVGYGTNFAHKLTRFDKVSGTKFIGFYYGRFFGLCIGAFLGFEIAKIIGIIIGAISFYFAGRWIGPKIGFFIGHLIDRNLSVANVP